MTVANRASVTLWRVAIGSVDAILTTAERARSLWFQIPQPVLGADRGRVNAEERVAPDLVRAVIAGSKPVAIVELMTAGDWRALRALQLALRERLEVWEMGPQLRIVNNTGEVGIGRMYAVATSLAAISRLYSARLNPDDNAYDIQQGLALGYSEADVAAFLARKRGGDEFTFQSQVRASWAELVENTLSPTDFLVDTTWRRVPDGTTVVQLLSARALTFDGTALIAPTVDTGLR